MQARKDTVIMAIDPGSTESGYVVIQGTDFPNNPSRFGKILNSEMTQKVRNFARHSGFRLVLLIEMPACYGMAVGKTVFETCAVVGYLEATFWMHSEGNPDRECQRIYRKKSNEEGVPSVCMELCKNNRAGDSNIRQAIVDLYPATGGGKTPVKGTKDKPGPLFGISGDVWAALAVALTYKSHLKTLELEAQVNGIL